MADSQLILEVSEDFKRMLPLFRAVVQFCSTNRQYNCQEQAKRGHKLIENVDKHSSSTKA